MKRSFLVVLLAALAALSFLDLNQLLLHINTYVPIGYTTDYYHFHWDYWWIRHALMNGLPIYQTDYILYPLGTVNLGVHTLTPIWFPIWVILEPLIGHIAAMNTIIWFSLVLGGLWMFILLKDYTQSIPMAFTGAVFVMTLPYLGHAAELNHINLTPVFHFPLTLWLWQKIVKTRQIKWAILLGLEFWACWLTDTMWLLYIPTFLVAYGLYTLYLAPTWQIRRQLIMLGLVAVILFAGLSWFIAPWQQFISFDRNEVSPAGRDAAERWSLEWSVYFFRPDSVERGRSIGHVFTALLLVSLFLPNRGQSKERWFWLCWSVVPMILSLGTEITILGQKIDLPYLLLHKAQNGLFRTPERFLPIAIISALIFLVITWKPYVEKWQPKTRLWIFSLTLLVIIGDLRVQHPLNAGLPLQPYDFFDRMAAEDEDYVLLEVPVTMSSGWTEVYGSPETHYYILQHHKKIVSGHASRLPDFAHYYYANETVLGWLANRQPFKEDTLSTLERYVHEFPIGYVAVYQERMGWEELWTPDVVGYLNSFDFLCPVTIERDAIFYLTAGHPNPPPCPPRRLPEIAPETWQIPFGMRGDELFIGRGFYWQEQISGLSFRWIGAKELGEAQIFMELPPATYTVNLEAFAFHQNQPVQVSVNGQVIGELDIAPDLLETYTLTLPAEVFTQGENLQITLDYDQAVSGAELGISADSRPLVIALHQLTFVQEP